MPEVIEVPTQRRQASVVSRHLGVAWDRYRRFFWPLAAFELCALGMPCLTYEARRSLALTTTGLEAVTALGWLASIPFVAASVAAQRQAILGHDPRRNPLLLWDRKTYLVLVAGLPAWMLSWMLPQVLAFAQTLGTSQSVGTAWAVLAVAIASLYVILRLAPARAMAAGGQKMPIGICWARTQGRAWELFKLICASALPPVALVGGVVLALALKTPLKLATLLTAAFVPGMVLATFSRLALTSYAMELEKGAPSR